MRCVRKVRMRSLLRLRSELHKIRLHFYQMVLLYAGRKMTKDLALTGLKIVVTRRETRLCIGAAHRTCRRHPAAVSVAGYCAGARYPSAA